MEDLCKLSYIIIECSTLKLKANNHALLLDQFLAFTQKAPTPISPDLDKVKEYTAESIAEKYLEIMGEFNS